MTIDIFSLDLKAQAKKLASREIGCAELLEHYLSRIARFDGDLNAIVVPDFERARKRARQADEALAAGENWGPLHGVPVTVKESFDVAGLPSCWGDPAFKDNIAASDSAVARKLVEAGAIIIGKTNVPYMLSDWQTFNKVYGRTNNPWDLARSPGGSSGGSAAAVCAGLSALDIGSDIGSSVRNPAHYCGVYGHKPSFGIVSQAGHGLDPGMPATDMQVCGPLARHADDLELALDLLAGADGGDATAWKLELPPARKSSLADYRVAVMLDSPLGGLDRAVGKVLEETIAYLSREGVRVDFEARPKIDFQHAHELFMMLLRSAMAAAEDERHRPARHAQAAGFDADDRSYDAKLARSAVWSHRDWFQAHRERQRIRAAWGEFFRSHDLLLCPAASTAAFPHDPTPPHQRKILVNGQEELFREQFFWAGHASLGCLPATVASAGLTECGLPVGLQIVGPYLRDRETIHFARLLAEVNGGCVAPPLYRSDA